MSTRETTVLERCESTSIRITEVDKYVFIRKYFANCLDCHFCSDACCSHGCQVDCAEMYTILAYEKKLEPMVGIPSCRWFNAELERNSDSPSGECTRTKVYANKCVFYNHKSRGCTLHIFAAKEGIDHHLLKPMVCSLFPVSWENGRLYVSTYLDELPCVDHGISVFEAQKGELRYYFGDGFVRSLEVLVLQKKVKEHIDIGSN